MRAYGDIDLNKRIIQINKRKAKKSKVPGELINSIQHEKEHATHPKWSEKKVKTATEKSISKMSKKSKSKLYNLLK